MFGSLWDKASVFVYVSHLCDTICIQMPQICPAKLLVAITASKHRQWEVISFFFAALWFNFLAHSSQQTIFKYSQGYHGHSSGLTNSKSSINFHQNSSEYGGFFVHTRPSWVILTVRLRSLKRLFEASIFYPYSVSRLMRLPNSVIYFQYIDPFMPPFNDMYH